MTLLTAALAVILVLTPVRTQAGSITCHITVGSYKIVEGAQGQEILADGFGSLLVPGKPKLPRKIFAIAIPPASRMTSLTVEDSERILLGSRYNIMPAPFFRIIGAEDAQHLARDKKAWQQNHDAVYCSDAVYPINTAEFIRTSAYRKYNLVDVSIMPFSYRPLTGKIFFHPEITIKVTYETSSSKYDLPLIDFHPETERTAREFILNYEEAQSWYPVVPEKEKVEPRDFVIITLQSLVDAVSSLAAWEEAKGRHCEVVTVEWIDAHYTGPDQAARIRKFLREKYPTQAWGIRDVLLVGHHDQVDMREGWAFLLGYGPPRTDFYYAELSFPDEASWDLNCDGHYGEPGVDRIDFFNEVNVGRIPWSDPAVVRQICEKSAAYEQNGEPAFKKNVLLLGAFFWADTDNAVLMEAKVDQPWMSDWTMTRMYEQNDSYYSDYPCDYELIQSNVVEQWSNGRFAFVNWAGHGGPYSAHIQGHGEAAFIRSTDCPSLNDGYPAIIFANSCSNSDTNYNNIGREMLKNGAVGFVGATEVAGGCQGWDDPSDGSSQSLDYYFTTGVTSGKYTQGASLQRALRKLYVDGNHNHFQTYEWTLWGNPDLGLNYYGSPADWIPLVAAPGPWEKNAADVRVFNALEGQFLLGEMKAYNADKFGANVAVGDLDQDYVCEIITGPGPGPVFSPHIRAFEVKGEPVIPVNFLAYGTKKFGAKVASGDVDHDGFSEIITGAGPGAVFGPHVRGWNYDGRTVEPIHGINFFAYGTRQYGVNPACGDVDGDGMDEIITGPGPGAVFGPHVRGWNYDSQTTAPISSINYFAYACKHHGVRVCAGDICGGSVDEIITGPGPGVSLGPNVRAFSCETGPAELIPGVNFLAYPEYMYGVVVAAGDADGEAKHEIITGPGPGHYNFSHVRGWHFDGSSLQPSSVIDFQAFNRPRSRYGINVAIDR